MNSLLLHATSVERNKLKLQNCNLLRRTEMGREWTSSLHSTNRLCSSHILRMSGGAFLRRTSATYKHNIHLQTQWSLTNPPWNCISLKNQQWYDRKYTIGSDMNVIWNRPEIYFDEIQKTLLLQYDAAPSPVGFWYIQHMHAHTSETHWSFFFFLSLIQYLKSSAKQTLRNFHRTSKMNISFFFLPFTTTVNQLFRSVRLTDDVCLRLTEELLTGFERLHNETRPSLWY